MKGFKSSFCNTVFFMILIFAALQVFLNSFLIKWGKKWKRLWNSSKKIWIQYIQFEMISFVIFRNGDFHNVVWNSTLKWTTLLRRCLTLFISTLKHTNIDLKLPDVVNSNVETRRCFNVDLKFSYVATSYQSKDNVTMFKQRWNVSWNQRCFNLKLYQRWHWR